MKTLARKILFVLLCGSASFAFAATPAIDVTVADPSGKVAFKGKTKADGTFSTGKLQPGNYIVQFNSDNVKGDYAIVVSAGKKKVTADAVTGSKFAKGGVAMKVDVAAGMNISGQVAAAGAAMASSGNSNVKVMNGKRYVWVKAETGSNLGGRWVEEGSPEARNVTRMSAEGVRNMQERGNMPISGGN
jgi:hypothetical protein